MRRALVLLASLLAIACLLQPCAAQTLEDLRVGNWVELRGDLTPDGLFRANSVEVLSPGSSEILIGSAGKVDVAGRRFTLLGRTVRITATTTFKGLALRSLEGARIRVGCRWRGEDDFTARMVAPDATGGDGIRARVDVLERTAQGLEIEVIGLRALVLSDAKVANEKPFVDLPLAPEVVHAAATPGAGEREDFIPGTLHLTDDLTLGALIEYGRAKDEDFDLSTDENSDRTSQYLLIKGQLAWKPSDVFRARLVERYEFRDRVEVNGPQSNTGTAQLDEAWGHWTDLFGTAVDLRAGRQKFVDEREWIYRAFLDAGRFIWSRPGLRLELSASTVLFGGTERDMHTDNFIAYLSNNDRQRELAAWVVDRRDDRTPRDYPIHFGVRAYGHWIPENRVWADASLLRGYTGTVNLKGYAVDLGTTWSPPKLAPLSFTVGWALGSGDDPGTTTVDENFRQTGLQRNKDRWAGIVNFRYYGELFDPELSNLSILTLGAGARLAPRVSLDLVWHRYAQAETEGSLFNTNLKANPDGLHRDLGEEFDVILGFKPLKTWDLELVFGRFLPGDAFPGADDASLASVVLRYRF